jgi:hypothetical protein
MRRLRLTLVPALVLGAGLILSACGDDGSPEVSINVPTETTASTLSKQDYITDADTACEEVNTAISQFAASGQGLTEADQIADLRAGLADQLKELGPPEEDRATADQFIAAVQAQVQAGQKIALANERGEDTAEFEAELQTAKDQAAAAAQSYGFQQCGQEVSSSATTTAPSASSGTGSGTSVEPAAPSTPAPSTDSGGTADTGGGTGDTGSGTGGDTGGDTGSGGVGAGGGVGPG